MAPQLTESIVTVLALAYKVPQSLAPIRLPAPPSPTTVSPAQSDSSAP